jgi:hypothetical protein
MNGSIAGPKDRSLAALSQGTIDAKVEKRAPPDSASIENPA